MKLFYILLLFILGIFCGICGMFCGKMIFTPETAPVLEIENEQIIATTTVIQEILDCEKQNGDFNLFKMSDSNYYIYCQTKRKELYNNTIKINE